MQIRIIKTPITKEELKEIAEEGFGDLVKAVVDIYRGIMALGGELHADEEAMLLENDSAQSNVWGINLYPAKRNEEFVEFESIINLRPAQGNRSRAVEDSGIQLKIKNIVKNLVRG